MLNIESIPLKWIKPSPDHPRKKLNKRDPVYQHLLQSIQTFGYVVPLVWNERTGHIVNGHQRLEVLQKQGMVEFICSIVDLDTNQEKMLHLALNKIAGNWDIPKLKKVLYELSSKEANLQQSGFETDEIIDLFVPVK